MGSPPGPRLQRLNALLHREPLASIAHSLYWSLVLLLATPVIVVILHVQGIVNLLVWSMGWTGDGYYDPRRRQQEGSPPNTELAVIITGCDSGFGKEFALWADRAGYTVFAGCLSKESFAQFEEGCCATMIPVLLDVTREEDVRKAVTTVESWLAEGSTAGTNKRLLHAVCNNAGIIMPGLVDWIDVATVERVMDVNFFGMVRCCKAFLPLLKKQSASGAHTGGRIINVASMAGKVIGGAGFPAYGASKHAAVAFSHGLRREVAPFGIQVCTLCPTFHGTKLVTDMSSRYDALWKTMSKDMKEEYGEDYLRFAKCQVHNVQLLMWKMDVVVEQMMRVLTLRTVPAELLVGSDAKFIFPILRMLPHWVCDLLLRLSERAPIPAGMKSQTGTT